MNNKIMVTTSSGKEIEITRRVFTLAKHPNNPAMLRSSGEKATTYFRDEAGALHVVEPPKISKKQRNKMKKLSTQKKEVTTNESTGKG